MTCVPHTTYFESPDFIADALNVLIWLEVPVLAFGGYCILFKTPNNMSSVKWLMLNMHFWTAMFDLAISFFGVPYIMFPAMAGWGLGVVQLPGFVFFSSVILLGALSASVVSIYENRYHRLFGQKTWWSRVRKPFLVFMFLFAPTFFIPTYFYIPDQELARQEVFNSLSCIPFTTIADKPMYVLSLDLIAPSICIAVAAIVFGPSWTTFSILIFWNILYDKKFTNSLRTHSMQKKFAIAFSIQSAFLLLIIMGPVFLVVISVITLYHNQTLNNLVYIILSLHGIGSTIVMVLVHKPYRDFTFSKFKMAFRRNKNCSNHVSTIAL